MKKQKVPICAPRTAVAYARYSSAGQRDVSIEQQLADIRAFAKREGYTLVHEYADHAKSGYKDTSARTAFQAMMAAAENGGFDTVISWKVDRFGRNREDSAIYKGKLRRSYVCRWFTANVPNAPQNPKTYARDLVSFRSYFPDKDRYDFREPMIVMLLRNVANPQFKGKDRERMKSELTDLLHYLKSRQDANNGTPVEIPKYAWQYTGGKKGSRELVAVSADTNPIDDMEF